MIRHGQKLCLLKSRNGGIVEFVIEANLAHHKVLLRVVLNLLVVRLQSHLPLHVPFHAV